MYNGIKTDSPSTTSVFANINKLFMKSDQGNQGHFVYIGFKWFKNQSN